MRWRRGRRIACGLAAAWLGAGAARATNGHLLHGVGPVNQAMGGAGTAAFLEPIGTTRWNPAGAVRLEGDRRFELAAEFFRPDRSVGSTVEAGAFGPFGPPVRLSGETDSETNAAVLPSFAFVQKSGADAAFHVSLFGIAGFGVEYPADPSNPILTPQPPGGLGFGAIESEYQLAQGSIGYSRRFGDRLSVGVAALPSMARLKVSPAPFATPDDANGDGFRSYPAASDLESALGVGFQLGASYLVDGGWTFGLSYSTPVRFDEFEWSSRDEAGNPRSLRFRLDLPAMAGLGVSRRTSEDELFAIDFRFINYQRTRGFEDSGFDAQGRVRGFGWKDILVAGFGYQRRLDDRWTARFGYNYNQNPIEDEQAFFNTPAPAVVEHRLSAGASRELGGGRTLHLAAYHGFEGHHAGRFVGPQGPVPGTQVESFLKEDSVSVAYGLRW